MSTLLVMFGIGLLVLWILFKVFRWPLKVLSKLIVNAFLGALTLILINMVGGFFDFTLPINAFTSLLVGIMGVPGVVIIAAWVFFI